MKRNHLRTLLPGVAFCLAVTGMSAQSTSHVLINVSQNQAAPTAEQLSFRVNGKPATITRIEPISIAGSPLEIVVLIDSALRNSLSKQLGEIRDLTGALPRGAYITLAYIKENSVVLTTPLTNDPAVVDKGIQMPVASGSSLSSPYSALSVLAHNWPSNNTHARRIAVLISGGSDPYEHEYNSDNVQVEGAIADATRAGIQIYSIYWSQWQNAGGQNHLSTLSLATGGEVFGTATLGSSSFSNYFEQVLKTTQSQFLVQLAVPIKFKAKNDVQPLELKTSGLQGRVVAPTHALLGEAQAVAK